MNIKQANSNMPSQSQSTYNIPIYPTLNETKQFHKQKVKIVIDEKTMQRFLKIQGEIQQLNAEGVFDGLTKVEEEFERVLKSKKQADINYKVLCEQSNKERIDYENITSPTVQAYFRTREDHNRAIEKEKVIISY